MKIPGRISSEGIRVYNCNLVVSLVENHQYKDRNPNSDSDLVIDVSVEDMVVEVCLVVQVMHFHEDHLYTHMQDLKQKNPCLDNHNNVENSGKNSENCVVCNVVAPEQQLCCVGPRFHRQR